MKTIAHSLARLKGDSLGQVGRVWMECGLSLVLVTWMSVLRPMLSHNEIYRTKLGANVPCFVTQHAQSTVEWKTPSNILPICLLVHLPLWHICFSFSFSPPSAPPDFVSFDVDHFVQFRDRESATQSPQIFGVQRRRRRFQQEDFQRLWRTWKQRTRGRHEGQGKQVCVCGTEGEAGILRRCAKKSSICMILKLEAQSGIFDNSLNLCHLFQQRMNQQTDQPKSASN